MNTSSLVLPYRESAQALGMFQRLAGASPTLLAPIHTRMHGQAMYPALVEAEASYWTR